MIRQDLVVPALTAVLEAAATAKVNIDDITISDGEGREDPRFLIQGTSGEEDTLSRAAAVALLLTLGADEYEVSGIYGSHGKPLQSVTARIGGVDFDCIALAESGEQA